MPASLPTNIAPNTLYNNLNVRGTIKELNGSSLQWNNAYLNLFGSEYIQLGNNLNTLTSGTITSVSINSRGDKIAVGFNTPTATAGITRIYEWNGLSWNQLGGDIPGEAAGDQSGWSVSLNAIGDRVAIGAPLNDGIAKPDSGHVRVYRWDGTNWAKLGAVNVDVDGEFTGDQSGWSVSLNAIGDRVAVSAIYNDGTTGVSGDNRGSVRIYQWNETTWTRLGSIDLDGEAAGDQSGWSVSLNAIGDRVAIGANLNDSPGKVDAGQVRVYEWDGTSWTQMGIDLDGEAAGDQSGYCVSLNSAGDRIAVSAINNDGTTGVSGDNRGSVRVYEWNGLAWTQMGIDLDGEFAGDNAGISIALNAVGDRLVIGSKLNDSGASNSGHIRIYQWDGADWVKFRDIDGITSNDYIGTNLAVNSVGDIICSNSFDSINIFTNSSRVLSEKWNNNSTGKTIFVDSVVGNDSRFNTTPYNEHRPYATISAAVAASVAGDLIYVRAGSYSISSSINLNSKGHLYFDLGSTVTVATGITAFTYNQNSVSIAINGYADFVTAGTGALLNLSGGNSTTKVSFECSSISSSAGNGILFSIAAGEFTLDTKTIQVPSATVFSISNAATVIARVPIIRCNRYLNASGTSSIRSDTRSLSAANSTAGISVTSVATLDLNIEDYEHAGVGVSFAWTQDTQTENIIFNSMRWKSIANLSHIDASTTAASMTSKTIKLRGTNTFVGITNATNCINSTKALSVCVQNSFAATSANSNINFTVGSFTVNADTNNF